MAEKFYKKVLMPIKVSCGDYCWDSHRICEHFNNEGGHPECGLDIDELKYDKDMLVRKPEKCASLKKA